MSEANNNTGQNNQPIFSIEKIYVKNISLEAPHTPQIFLEQGESEVSINLDTVSHALSEDIHECMLTITVTAKLPDERVLFLVEVEQCGIFRLSQIPPEEIDPLLGIACPNILFPYVRESISSIVTRAGFMPVLLAPINFEEHFMHRQAAQQEAKETQH